MAYCLYSRVFFGIVASRKPTFRWIVTLRVFSIISASFCLPLLVISSIGASHYYHRGKYAEHAVSAMQIIISLIQAAVTITSAGMACRAVCCGPRRESRLVYYNVSGGSNANNAIYQHITMPDQPRGYITIPMRQVQDVFASATAPPPPNQMAYTSSSVMITKVHKSPVRRPTEPPPPAPNISRIGSQVQAVATPAGSTAFPTMSIIPSTAETNISRNSHPPRYENIAQMENDNETKMIRGVVNDNDNEEKMESDVVNDIKGKRKKMMKEGRVKKNPPMSKKNDSNEVSSAILCLQKK